jgi:hypothetical protein
MKRLTCENPTTLDQYEPSTRIAEGELNYVATQIERHENILFDTITLARENNLFAILPCAYLRVILFYDQVRSSLQFALKFGATEFQYLQETILDGIPQDDGPPLKLSSQDQRLCRLGSQKIFQAQWEQPQFWGWFTLDGCAEGCTDKVGCAAWKNIVFRELVKKQASLAPFQLGSDPRLCSVCAVKHAEILVEVRKKLWDDLPSFFDLPPWAELKNDL